MAILYPAYTLRSRLDMHYLRRYSAQYEDLSGEVHCFDAAREIHEKLSEALGDGKRTFFDQQEEESKDGQIIEPEG